MYPLVEETSTVRDDSGAIEGALSPFEIWEPSFASPEPFAVHVPWVGFYMSYGYGIKRPDSLPSLKRFASRDDCASTSLRQYPCDESGNATDK